MDSSEGLTSTRFCDLGPFQDPSLGVPICAVGTVTQLESEMMSCAGELQ